MSSRIDQSSYSHSLINVLYDKAKIYFDSEKLAKVKQSELIDQLSICSAKIKKHSCTNPIELKIFQKLKFSIDEVTIELKKLKKIDKVKVKIEAVYKQIITLRLENLKESNETARCLISNLKKPPGSAQSQTSLPSVRSDQKEKVSLIKENEKCVDKKLQLSASSPNQVEKKPKSAADLHLETLKKHVEILIRLALEHPDKTHREGNLLTIMHFMNEYKKRFRSPEKL